MHGTQFYQRKTITLVGYVCMHSNSRQWHHLPEKRGNQLVCVRGKEDRTRRHEPAAVLRWGRDYVFTLSFRDEINC